jgi:nucleoside diphosphate kinase
MLGLEVLAEEISKSNGVILSVIAELRRAGFELKRIKVVEVDDEELEELENLKAN